jgi:hypothetical protein
MSIKCVSAFEAPSLNDSSHKDSTETQLNARVSDDGEKKSIIPEHSRRIEKCHQKVASNLACNRTKKMETA